MEIETPEGIECNSLISSQNRFCWTEAHKASVCGCRSLY